MFIKKIRAWWVRKKWFAKLTDPNISAEIERDIGVRVTRIRLPSGAEVVIVKRSARDE